MNKRIEDLKDRTPLKRLALDTYNPHDGIVLTDGFYHVSESDFLWLLDVVEASVMTRNMIEACFGKTIDETLTIFLDKVLEVSE